MSSTSTMYLAHFIAGLFALASAIPSHAQLIPRYKPPRPLHPRAALFAAKTYAELSISEGTAGKAKEEALAKLAGLPSDLVTMDAADIKFLDSVNAICKYAEISFNSKIADSQPGEEALALNRGRTKNKILKLTAKVIKLEAESAQGKGDVEKKLAKAKKELEKSISHDEEDSGRPSAGIQFAGSTDNPDQYKAEKDKSVVAKMKKVVKESEDRAGIHHGRGGGGSHHGSNSTIHDDHHNRNSTRGHHDGGHHHHKDKGESHKGGKKEKKEKKEKDEKKGSGHHRPKKYDGKLGMILDGNASDGKHGLDGGENSHEKEGETTNEDGKGNTEETVQNNNQGHVEGTEKSSGEGGEGAGDE